MLSGGPFTYTHSKFADRDSDSLAICVENKTKAYISINLCLCNIAIIGLVCESDCCPIKVLVADRFTDACFRHMGYVLRCQT